MNFYDLCSAEITELISKIESATCRGTNLVVRRLKVTTKLILSGVTEHYDEEFIKMYFESTKRSGGGEVESVEPIGDGVAEIIFRDSKGESNDNNHAWTYLQ